MKRIATASLILFLAGGVLLAGPDEDYLTIYDHIQKADALEQGHQFQAAAAGYLQAVQDLQKFQKEHPTSNAAAVSYRLDYLMNNKLKEPFFHERHPRRRHAACLCHCATDDQYIATTNPPVD